MSMSKKLMNALVNSTNTAIAATDRTLEERVATNALAAWQADGQKGGYVVSETEAREISYIAQKAVSEARTAAGNVAIAIPPTSEYAHADFKSFDNQAARLRNAIRYAPEAPNARALVEAMATNGAIPREQRHLKIATAMKKCAEGTSAAWEKELKDKADKALVTRAATAAKAASPEGFKAKLTAWGDKAEAGGMVFDAAALATLLASVAPKPVAVVEDKPVAVVAPAPTAEPQAFDVETMLAMLPQIAHLPQDQQSMMVAAFMKR